MAVTSSSASSVLSTRGAIIRLRSSASLGRIKVVALKSISRRATDLQAADPPDQSDLYLILKTRVISNGRPSSGGSPSWIIGSRFTEVARVIFVGGACRGGLFLTFSVLDSCTLLSWLAVALYHLVCIPLAATVQSLAHSALQKCARTPLSKQKMTLTPYHNWQGVVILRTNECATCGDTDCD